jgi:lipopolysaccharide export system protein LptC
VTASPVTPLPRPEAKEPAARRIRITSVRVARRPLDRRYSMMVGMLRMALPLAAVAIMAAVVIWPQLVRDPFESIAALDLPGIATEGEILNPRFTGVDDNNRPYSVTAREVAKVPGGGDVYRMTAPSAAIGLEGGSAVTLEAESGALDRAADRLQLDGGVTLRRDDGTVLTTAAAIVDLAGEGAAGSAPVHAEGPFGSLTAAGFRVEKRGAVVIFTGPADLHLKSDAGETLK